VNNSLIGAGPEVMPVPDVKLATGTAAVDGLTNTKINTTAARNNTFVDFIPFTLPPLSINYLL
jgi:TRAP-type C4-dicarboxylate transport system substrate-binding protein